jgi:hypothetical protein
MIMADKLIYLFRVIMMVFNAGNVNYNSLMMSNTLMVDFFMRNHRLLARGLSFEFVDKILFRLIHNDRYWYFLNSLNSHLFYLNYRTKMMNVICHQMAKVYGTETFGAVFNRISPGVRGREEYPACLGNLFFFLLSLFECSSYFIIDMLPFHLICFFRNSQPCLEQSQLGLERWTLCIMRVFSTTRLLA